MPKPVIWSPEMDAALIELRALGLGARKCGKRIGVADKIVLRRAAELGLPPRPRPDGKYRIPPKLEAARLEMLAIKARNAARKLT